MGVKGGLSIALDGKQAALTRDGLLRDTVSIISKTNSIGPIEAVRTPPY